MGILLLGMAPVAFAAKPPVAPTNHQTAVHAKQHGDAKRRGAGGIVTAISGTTITISSGHKDGTSYTVDASHARMMSKGRSLADVSKIKVGDSVAVIGTESGTSLLAQTIIVKPGNDKAPKAFTAFSKTLPKTKNLKH